MKKSLLTLAVAAGMVASSSAFAEATVYGHAQVEIGSWGGDSTGVSVEDNARAEEEGERDERALAKALSRKTTDHRVERRPLGGDAQADMRETSTPEVWAVTGAQAVERLERR